MLFELYDILIAHHNYFKLCPVQNGTFIIILNFGSEISLNQHFNEV